MICRRFSTIAERSDFGGMNEELLCLLLKRDDLDIEEELDVLNALLS